MRMHALHNCSLVSCRSWLCSVLFTAITMVYRCQLGFTCFSLSCVSNVFWVVHSTWYVICVITVFLDLGGGLGWMLTAKSDRPCQTVHITSWTVPGLNHLIEVSWTYQSNTFLVFFKIYLALGWRIAPILTSDSDSADLYFLGGQILRRFVWNQRDFRGIYMFELFKSGQGSFFRQIIQETP